MDLSKELSSFGTVRAKPTRSLAKNPRENFASNADGQIRRIERGEKTHNWFRIDEDGNYVVTLRNGVAVMYTEPMKGEHVCPTKGDAIGLLNRAKELALAGHFDALFAATAKKTKQTQS